MKDQLIFKFPSVINHLKQDFFISSSNSEAFNIIQSCPKWIKKTANIFGPTGSGKSHLVSIFEKKISSIKISGHNISDDIFLKLKLKEALIIEDLNEKFPENILYSLFNVSEQDNKFILMTSTKSIVSLNFKLPDLISRVKNCSIIEIKLPEDDLIDVILTKNFSDRQIAVNKKYIHYITKRIDRSYEKIFQFISILDEYSLKKGKSFSFKVIKEALDISKG